MERALAYLEGMPQKYRRQVLTKIGRLASEPYPAGCKALQGVRDGEDPVYRIRSGDYRVLYVVRNPLLVILDVDHRKDVYR
jgi:mRNA interferase RelE/StbE